MDKTLMIGLLLGFTVLIVLSALILNRQKKCSSSENYANDDWFIVKNYNSSQGKSFPVRVSWALQKNGDVFSGTGGGSNLTYRPLKITLNNSEKDKGSGHLTAGTIEDGDYIDTDINWEKTTKADGSGKDQPYIYLNYEGLVLTKGGILDLNNELFDLAYPAAKEDLCG